MKQIVLLLAVVFLLSGCSNMLYDYRDDKSDNVLKLPHDYRLFSSDGELNYVSKKQDSSPVAIDSDIIQIGWNENYIVYKRVESGDINQWGILNMEDGTSQTYTSEAGLNTRLEELKLDSLKLTDVQDLLEHKKK
ncbi:hypothetical protein [Paenibacillus sp. MMS20-IR301]|uniref:hypothetical protein n=1 Tax=Paenibacillus sp. MMS20-IR301 TaxID=2895946 RepID=UPI0028EC30B2|nr:hypothetical protein [Paenibacillus sp. MMS20-IR301]WNS42311.1 hypothetical protein LOS79_25520 [Paenibacillus sp. MMS20-IR301]